MKRRSIIILVALAASTAGVSQARAEGMATALPTMGKSYSGGHHMGRPMMPRPGGGMHMTPRPGGGMHNWGPRQNGRWHAGWRAPGGWNGYQRPVRGYILPRYWVSPSYYIANYGSYGLPQPAYGYGWSRYYDDAVMTDRYGRVYDSRSNVAWDRYGDRYDDDGYYDDRGNGGRDYRRQDNGLGGAAIGAVVGGVAGNRIAGRGNRTAGTIIGAATGAVAGAIIDRAEDSGRGARNAPPPRRGAGYDYGYGYADDNVTSNNDYDYEGRWTGTWRDQNGRTVNGEYEGRFEGTVSGGPGVDYDAPAYKGGGAHWSNSEGDAAPAGYGHGGGYVSNGWYYPAPTVTTVTITPAMTTTTTYETVSYVRKPVRRAARKVCRCK